MRLESLEDRERSHHAVRRDVVLRRQAAISASASRSSVAASAPVQTSADAEGIHYLVRTVPGGRPFGLLELATVAEHVGLVGTTRPPDAEHGAGGRGDRRGPLREGQPTEGMQCFQRGLRAAVSRDRPGPRNPVVSSTRHGQPIPCSVSRTSESAARRARRNRGSSPRP